MTFTFPSSSSHHRLSGKSPLLLLLLLSLLLSPAAVTAATTTHPSPCPSGHFRALATRACTPCPPGHYNWYPHATSCTPCPPNTYTPYVGVVDRSLCLACPIDSYSPAGSASCMRCSVGQVRREYATGPPSVYHHGKYQYTYHSSRTTISTSGRQLDYINNNNNNNNKKLIIKTGIKQKQPSHMSSITTQRRYHQPSSSSSSNTAAMCAPCTHQSCLCSFHSCPSPVITCKRSGYILPPPGVSYFAPSVCVSAVTGCPGNLTLRQFVRRAICQNAKTGVVVCPTGYLFDGVDRCVTCQPGAKLVHVPGNGGKYHRKVRCVYCGGNSVSPGGLATKCTKCPCGYAPTMGRTKCFNTIPDGVDFSCD